MATANKNRTRTRTKGWPPRTVLLVVVVGAAVVVGGIGLYMRERRLEAKRRIERQHFLEKLDREIEASLTDAERQTREQTHR